MGRPRQYSRVQVPPRVRGFIPLAYYAGEDSPVELNLEEYEAIRLLDYEHLSQEQAAEFMEVSRPTLTRIYDRARQKVALALTEAHQLLIEGGKALFEGEWYLCKECDSKFNNPHQNTISSCALCSGTSLERIREAL
jgi:uncharacterized protein